jgi:hypothetical protein
MLLQEGNIIYQGKANLAVEYFLLNGYVISRQKNPADFYMKEFYVPYIKK